MLIIDDEPFIHQLYRDVLEFNGFHIIAEAFDGQEAIEVYSELGNKPDVVIMDHRMPNKDGVEATIKIKEMDPNAKIIFASADSTIKPRAIEAGAVQFLCKPFQIKDLIDTLAGI
ncbi:MAG: response regulator [Thermoplasmatota archaeon]